MKREVRRLTMAQALIRFLRTQSIERDGRRQRFFAGIWGIFGHGNVAGIGQALEEDGEFRYYQARNEQGMVHASVAFAKQQRRLRAFACTSSIGPGATNMITAAAGATINRLPVLLLPGDSFARRQLGPVLQQLEHPCGPDESVNDCFKPVSRFWDRINRPEQILVSLPEAMRILTSPSETGAVTLALPQDVQTEAYAYPEHFFEDRVYKVYRSIPCSEEIEEAARVIRAAERPLIIAGGGVLYSEAEEALRIFCERTGIPVGETQAGKGTLPWDHPLNLGGVGTTGTKAANLLARDADVVIAIGTRLSDFTTASGTQFASPNFRLITLNINAFDSYKYGAIPVIGDARVGLERLTMVLKSFSYFAPKELALDIARFKEEWQNERDRWVNLNSQPFISQGEVIGIVNEILESQDTVVCAAGGLPGDMHKLMNIKNSGQYHMEYGYSCMGYEIAGGLGVKLAKSNSDLHSSEVFVLVGDGSYLMLNTEIVTSLQEGQKLIIILLDNRKFGCIDRLSRSCGGQGFGNEFRHRGEDGQLSGDFIKIDYLSNAASLGAHAIRSEGREGLRKALLEAKSARKTTVIVVDIDPAAAVPGYESRWEVPVAEVSEIPSVKKARAEYEQTFLKRS